MAEPRNGQIDPETGLRWNDIQGTWEESAGSGSGSGIPAIDTTNFAQAASVLGITLTGDKAHDDDVVAHALGGASTAQKAAFFDVRYAATSPMFAADIAKAVGPVTSVLTGDNTRVSVDDPSVAFARDYYEGINAAAAKTVSEFNTLVAQAFSGKPTAEHDDSFGVQNGTTSPNSSPDIVSAPQRATGQSTRPTGFLDRASDLLFGRPVADVLYSGGGRIPDVPVDDGSGDGGIVDIPDDPTRHIAPRDRTLEDYGGSRPGGEIHRAIPVGSSDDTGGGGGGSSGSGSGGGPSGESNSHGPPDSSVGGTTATQDSLQQSTIDRLIDLAAAQFAGAGGGGSSGGGVVALPTEIATDTAATSNGGKGLLVVVIIAAVGIGIYLYRKHKKAAA